MIKPLVRSHVQVGTEDGLEALFCCWRLCRSLVEDYPPRNYSPYRATTLVQQEDPELRAIRKAQEEAHVLRGACLDQDI